MASRKFREHLKEKNSAKIDIKDRDDSNPKQFKLQHFKNYLKISSKLTILSIYNLKKIFSILPF